MKQLVCFLKRTKDPGTLSLSSTLVRLLCQLFPQLNPPETRVHALYNILPVIRPLFDLVTHNEQCVIVTFLRDLCSAGKKDAAAHFMKNGCLELIVDCLKAHHMDMESAQICLRLLNQLSFDLNESCLGEMRTVCNLCTISSKLNISFSIKIRISHINILSVFHGWTVTGF